MADEQPEISDNTNSVTDADIAQTKATPPENAVEMSKLNVSKNDNGKWEVTLEYHDEDGKTITGETKTFDVFSQASAYVAGAEVEMKDNDQQN